MLHQKKEGPALVEQHRAFFLISSEGEGTPRKKGKAACGVKR